MLSEKRLKELQEYGWDIVSLKPFKIQRSEKFLENFRVIESEREAVDELARLKNDRWIKEFMPEFFQKFTKIKNQQKDPARIDSIIEKLTDLWKKNPDLRLGQMLTNINSSKNNSGDMYYLSDADLEKYLEDFLKAYK